jgi:hypothetical protein
MYAIVPATQAHVAQMLPKVRRDDRHEVMAAYGYPVEELLGRCVAKSELAWAGMVDDEVACIFGVVGASLLSETGYPWLVGTDLIEAHAKAFLRRNKKMVAVMLERFPRLENYVDVRNTKSIQWLTWLGFSFDDPAPYGIYRMPFMKFTKEV